MIFVDPCPAHQKTLLDLDELRQVVLIAEYSRVAIAAYDKVTVFEEHCSAYVIRDVQFLIEVDGFMLDVINVFPAEDPIFISCV